MFRETGVQSQVESYQRLKKWCLIPTWLTLSIIRYVSRVKWSNPGIGVAPSPTPRCSSYWKRSLRVALDYGRQLTYIGAHISYRRDRSSMCGRMVPESALARAYTQTHILSFSLSLSLSHTLFLKHVHIYTQRYIFA